MVLLDTHVLIWSAVGDTRRLGRRARTLLTTAESRSEIRVSTITLFEITALHTLGRLRLTRTPERWIRDVLDGSGIRLAELSFDVAVDAGTIPRAAVADPIDRLLIATARQLDAVFLTADKRILGYASAADRVRAHDAGR